MDLSDGIWKILNSGSPQRRHVEQLRPAGTKVPGLEDQICILYGFAKTVTSAEMIEKNNTIEYGSKPALDIWIILICISLPYDLCDARLNQAVVAFGGEWNTKHNVTPGHESIKGSSDVQHCAWNMRENQQIYFIDLKQADQTHSGSTMYVCHRPNPDLDLSLAALFGYSRFFIVAI